MTQLSVTNILQNIRHSIGRAWWYELQASRPIDAHKCVSQRHHPASFLQANILRKSSAAGPQIGLAPELKIVRYNICNNKMLLWNLIRLSRGPRSKKDTDLNSQRESLVRIKILTKSFTMCNNCHRDGTYPRANKFNKTVPVLQPFFPPLPEWAGLGRGTSN